MDIRLQDYRLPQPRRIQCEYSQLIKSVKLLNFIDIRSDLSQMHKTAEKIDVLDPCNLKIQYNCVQLGISAL